MAGRRRRIVRAAVQPPSLGLAGVVIAWWLLLGGAAVWLSPEAAVSATLTPFTAAPGQRARIRQPGIRDWPVPTTRLAFEGFQRGVRESDESAINDAFTDGEWLAVNHGDDVRIVAVDGEVVEVE